jgi:hypothetical protein
MTFFLILVCVLCPFWASAHSMVEDSQKLDRPSSQGGVSDGGSSGIYVGHRLVLLDLYAANPLFRDDKNGSALRTYQGKKWPVVVVKEQPAFAVAMKLIEHSQQPEGLKSVIIEALTYMEFWSINDEFPVKRAFLPDWLRARASNDRIKTIAMYSDLYGGAALSKGAWDKLGEISQAGVLIHEALRHIQFVDATKTEDASHLSDKSLQELTASIVFGTAPAKDQQLGSFLMSVVKAFDLVARQNKITEICRDIETKFPTIMTKFTGYCQDEAPQDEIAALHFLGDFANSLTNLLPDMLMSKVTAREFMTIRDKAQILHLQTLLGSVRKTNFRFMQLNYQMDAISF